MKFNAYNIDEHKIYVEKKLPPDHPKAVLTFKTLPF